jgi:DNA-binding LacI/PurR family transcriptional regulator
MAVLTKSKQIEQQLRESIKSGRWAIGSMLPAERDLLSDYNVSRSTLREALTSLVNEGLVVRKPGSGTYVADQGQNKTVVVTGHARNIASDWGQWHVELIEKAQECITAADQRSALWVGSNTYFEDLLEEMPHFTRPDLHQTSGIFNTLYMEGFDEYLVRQGVPCVSVVSGLPIGRCSVVLNYASFVQTAVKLMHEHGYGDFSIMYSPVVPQCTHKGQLYMDHLFQAAVGFDEKRMLKITTEDVYEEARAYLSSPNRPRAIFFADDAFFDVTSRVISELGLRVPEDLAIVTHANVGRRFYFPIEVTRVGFSVDKAIEAAWDLLSRLIAGNERVEAVRYIEPDLSMGTSL